MAVMTGKAMKELLPMAQSIDISLNGQTMQRGWQNWTLGVMHVDHVCDADVDPNTRKLTVSSLANGQGLYLPYAENQSPDHGMTFRTLGSYTRQVNANGNCTWVCTGPFSGCRAAVFSSGTNLIFAHLVTESAARPENERTCTHVELQRSGVWAALPDGEKKLVDDCRIGSNEEGSKGWVFWLRSGAEWGRYTVYVNGSRRITSVEPFVRIDV